MDLGGEDDVVAPAAGQRLADDLLGLALGVDVGGVDEVDPGVQGPVDDPDALVVVGVAPVANIIAPRQNLLTETPVRPSGRCSMGCSLRVARLWPRPGRLPTRPRT
jgi:hypothetical protein